MLIAAVIHYRQSRERLARLVASLGNTPEGGAADFPRVDAAVFVDGPYRGLSDQPHSEAWTNPFIAEQCEAAGIQYAIFGGEVWDGEPAKRTAAAQCARLYDWEPLEQRRNEALGQENWLMVIDSDEWLESDIDWSLIEKHGTGTIVLRNWRDGDWAEATSGSGAKMVRVIPLLPGLVWGPTHFDIMDIHTGITLLGHEKGLATPNPACATFGHDVGTKTIAAEYQRYNDTERVEYEHRLLRISEVGNDGNLVVVRLDRDQAQAEWALGALAFFPGDMMPEGVEEMTGQYTHHADVPGQPLLLDLVFERRDPEQVAEIEETHRQVAEMQNQRDAILLQRRRQKHDRKRARLQRMHDAQQRRGR